MNRRAFVQSVLVGALLGMDSLGAQAQDQHKGEWLSPGPTVPDIQLIDHLGRPHRLHQLCRQPVIVSFFFTGCSTICPPQTAALHRLRKQLNAELRVSRFTRAPIMLSLSLDPLGDSPKALQRYAERYGIELGADAGWHLLTGEPHALAQAWRAFDAPVGRPADHSSLLWLGDVASRKWTRASALTPPNRMIALLRELS